MDDLLKYCLELEQEMISAERLLNKRMLEMLRPKSVSEIKELLQACSTQFMQHILTLAIDSQDYEICEAVKQIMDANK